MKQGSKEWLELRKNFIGASDAPIIMGVSPWMTPYQLWEQKLGFGKEQEETEAMRLGKQLEDVARKKYEMESLDSFDAAVIINPRVPFMMASLDGLSSCKRRIIEIKCANIHDHELAKNGEVPSKYFPQLQHQMACGGFQSIDYVSYNKKEDDIQIVTVQRDEEYITFLIQEETKFWDNVKNLQAPEFCDRDFRERDEEWKQIAMELYSIRQTMSDLKKKDKELSDQLKERSDGVNSRCGEYRYKVSYSKGTIDYSAIPELSGVDLEKYRKPTIQKWYLTKEKEDV